jgi:hypothetical protein
MEEAIAYLNGPAARLLLVVLLARARGKTRLRAGEMKRLAGIGTHHYWECAIADLERAGLATVRKVPRSHEYEFITNLASSASVRESVTSEYQSYDNLSYIDRCTSAAKPAERSSSAPLLPDLDGILGTIASFSENGTGIPHSGEPVRNMVQEYHNPAEYGTIVPKQNMVQEYHNPEYGTGIPNPQKNGTPDLKSECIGVDLLDDSGDLARAHSPAQVRRRAQIAVVQKVWTEFWPAQPALVAENAKWFLSHCNQSAEEVYDLLEYAKSRGVESPLGYARKTALNRERERPEAPIYVTSSAPAVVEVEKPFDQVEADRVERAAHNARVALWQRRHPNAPVPQDL